MILTNYIKKPDIDMSTLSCHDHMLILGDVKRMITVQKTLYGWCEPFGEEQRW